MANFLSLRLVPDEDVGGGAPSDARFYLLDRASTIQARHELLLCDGDSKVVALWVLELVLLGDLEQLGDLSDEAGHFLAEVI